MPKTRSTSKRPAHATQTKRSGFTIRRVFCIVCFSLLPFLLLSIFIRVAPIVLKPQIHSCTVYFPHPLATVANSAQSLQLYTRSTSVSSLLDIFRQSFLHSVSGDRPPIVNARYKQHSLVSSEQTPTLPFDELLNRTFLMIGGAYIWEFIERTHEWDIKLILVDDETVRESVTSRVHRFVGIEDFGRLSIQKPEIVIKKLDDLNLQVDGVFTLVEDEGPLAARLSEHYGLIGNSVTASDTSRNKVQVRTIMKENNLPVPPFALIKDGRDLDRAVNELNGNFPLFLKPVFGVAASFVARIDNKTDLVETYKRFQSTIDPIAHPIYHYGTDMMLETLLTGAEIQLELMVLNGEVIFHCFSAEYAPDRSYLVFPPLLSASERQILLNLAKKTVLAIGLSDGIIHCEMFYDRSKPERKRAQLIEVNNRLSRGFLPRHYVHQLLHGETHTDYHLAALYLSLGKAPPMQPRSTVPISLAVFPDTPSANGWETEGPCAAFVGIDSADAVNAGIAYTQLNQ